MSKLTEIDKRIKRDTKKLQEVEIDSTYTDEQSQRQIKRLEYRITGNAKNTITKLKNLQKSQGLNKLLKKFLIKIYFCQKELVS